MNFIIIVIILNFTSLHLLHTFIKYLDLYFHKTFFL